MNTGQDIAAKNPANPGTSIAMKTAAHTDKNPWQA
jgi:hypothetical protein